MLCIDDDSLISALLMPEERLYDRQSQKKTPKRREGGDRLVPQLGLKGQVGERIVENGGILHRSRPDKRRTRNADHKLLVPWLPVFREFDTSEIHGDIATSCAHSEANGIQKKE